MNHGFHYLPDTEHYRQADLETWLPRLNALGARWLVLAAPRERAIPEGFTRELLAAGIQPVLQFQLSPAQPPAPRELSLLFTAYRRQGLNYVSLFKRPNSRRAWPPNAWGQAHLVERFLDAYLPLAQACLHTGLTPLFPTLEPGGDYWDTAFLRAALESLRRRAPQTLLEQLVLSAESWAGARPLQWGAGGPERWPAARPYHTPPDSEDGRGFRIFDWYTALSRAALGQTLPIFLFGMGADPNLPDAPERNLQMARLLNGESIPGLEGLPPQVIGGVFGPLTTPKGDTSPARAGWLDPNGTPRPLAEALRQWVAQTRGEPHPPAGQPRAIGHYLLLPRFEWGISDYHLDLIRPFIKKYQPTIGFSLEEARTAQRVSVLGGAQAFPEAALNALRAAGILVTRLPEDGTDIASL